MGSLLKFCKKYQAVLITTVIFVAMCYVVAILASQYFSAPPNSSYTLVHTFSGKLQYIASFLRFDSAHYLAIAQQGYVTNKNLVVFFPLYPILLFVISKLFFMVSQANALVVSAVLISPIFLLFSGVMFTKLLSIDSKPQKTQHAFMLLLAFPMAFFYIAGYTEALFLLLSVSSFYFARKNLWLLASLAAMLAVATRLPGLLLLPALIVEYMHQKDWQLKNINADFLALCLVPLPFVAYFGYLRATFGSLAVYSQAYTASWPERVLNVNIFQTLYSPLQGFVVNGKLSLINTLALACAVGFIAVFALTYKKLRPSYLVYAVLGMVLPLLTTTLDSLPRYYMVIFPFYIALWQLARKREYLLYMYILCGAMLQALLIVLFTRGYFIG